MRIVNINQNIRKSFELDVANTYERSTIRNESLADDILSEQNRCESLLIHTITWIIIHS